MIKFRSAFTTYLAEIIERNVERLSQQGWVDPNTGGPDVELIRPLLGGQEERLPHEVDMVLANSYWVGAAYEAMDGLKTALAWYHLGQYVWRGGKQFNKALKDPPDFGQREAAARNQLPAAICADRVGEAARARDLYLWAAENRTLTPREMDELTKTRQYTVLWEWGSARAYALACLERWAEAMAVAVEVESWAERDRRAQTRESYRAPLRILPVVMALARYQVGPSEYARQAVTEMIDPQAVASRSHSDHLMALFFLYNLRARHPDLASPSPEELPPAERARQGSEACQKWMAHGGIHLDGTPESLRLLDEHARGIYRAARNDKGRKRFVFLWGSYFGEVVRRELAGGQWKLSTENLRESTVDWDMGEVELHLWPFNHAFEFVTGQKEETFYQLWEKTEKSYIKLGLAAAHSD